MPVRIESRAEPIPGYKLLERIGGGGFGEVWKAEAPGGLLKAIKFVYGDLQTAGDDGARAEQELKALSRVKTVRHPYILSLERYDIIDGQLIIVMELADRNLWDRFKECRTDGLPGIPREELLRYMEESAEALDLMNIQYQLQHLDIKPHNIFLTHNHIKVADFGLVKDLEGMVASVTGGVTPVYAAPETFDGYVSRYCDQYSLAIVYQELLTGQRPFSGTNVRQLILQHLQGVPKLDSLPVNDREAIAKALAKTPDQRHKNCRELVRALRGEQTACPPAKEPSAADPVRTESDSKVAADAVAGSDRPLTPVRQSAGTAPASLPGPVHDGTPAEYGEADVSQSQQVTFRVRPTTPSPGAGLKPLNSPPVAEAVPCDEVCDAAGDGLLTPALVIGLGQHGLKVLKRLRQEVQARFGAADAIPALRLLYIDTDPEATRDALRGPAGTALGPTEVMLARLNRPSHYLKDRDAQDACGHFDGWLNKRMLYRIPRTQLTAGVRALGRLAFCDNYGSIARRIREELGNGAEPANLAASDRASGLGIRRHRPRIYVVTSLAGGTGSGMFLDVAYVARSLHRQLGFGEPDVVCLCLLPPVGQGPGRIMALGNTCAALTELQHFSQSRQTFVARYDEREAPVSDAGPPFSRCLMLPLAEEADGAVPDTTVRAGELLLRELFTPLGRAADLRRSELALATPLRQPACQAFGMCRFAFPRRDLVRQVARQLCHQLVERWMSKDSKPLQAAVQNWVQEQWTSQELGADTFIAALQDAVARLLGSEPEALFTSVIQSTLAPVDSDGGASRTPPTLAPELVIDVLRELDQLLGRPDLDAVNPQAGRIPEALGEASAVLVSQWGQRLANLVVHLVDEPEYRLAGAEEAVRQIVGRIERALENHEKLGKDLAQRAGDARARIHALLRVLPNMPAKGRAAATTELHELLRNFPKWRNQSLLLQAAGRAFVSLRGNLTDQLREINFCRVRLGELMQAFSDEETTARARLLDTPPPAPAVRAPARVRPLLPAGCTTLEQAVIHFARDITPDDLQALDRQVQALIQQQFRALIHVCLTSANLMSNVRIAMEQEVARAVEARIGGTDAASQFFEHFPTDEEAAAELVSAFDEAVPDVTVSKSGPRACEIAVLAVPPTPAGERLLSLARQALPDVVLTAAPGSDEIIVYREAVQVPMADLANVGPAAQEAYRQMTAVEHFTPHSRVDIAFRCEPVAS